MNSYALKNFQPIRGRSHKQIAFENANPDQPIDPSRYTSLTYSPAFIARYGNLPFDDYHEFVAHVSGDFDAEWVPLYNMHANETLPGFASNITYKLFCDNVDANARKGGKPLFDRQQMDAAWCQLCFIKFDDFYNDGCQALVGNTPAFLNAPRNVNTIDDARSWGMIMLLHHVLKQRLGPFKGKMISYWPDKGSQNPGMDVDVRPYGYYEQKWMHDNGVADVVGNEVESKESDDKMAGGMASHGGPSFAYRPKPQN